MTLGGLLDTDFELEFNAWVQPKPDQNTAQLPGARLLFWDDRIENVEAARACGWTSFHFQTAVKFADEVLSLALIH